MSQRRQAIAYGVAFAAMAVAQVALFMSIKEVPLFAWVGALALLALQHFIGPAGLRRHLGTLVAVFYGALVAGTGVFALAVLIAPPRAGGNPVMPMGQAFLGMLAAGAGGIGAAVWGWKSQARDIRLEGRVKLGLLLAALVMLAVKLVQWDYFGR